MFDAVVGSIGMLSCLVQSSNAILGARTFQFFFFTKWNFISIRIETG
jgi:hypothetical protein